MISIHQGTVTMGGGIVTSEQPSLMEPDSGCKGSERLGRSLPDPKDWADQLRQSTCQAPPQ